jgi:hypothetical protein
VMPSRAAVRAWMVRCGSARGGITKLGSGGATTAPISDRRAPTGTWRGTSICLAARQQCGRDSVVYRIAAIASAPDSVSLAASTIGRRGEQPTGQLRCRYDATAAILSCDAPAGVLRLAVRGPELGGRLTRPDGVYLRYVYLQRARK